MKTQNWKIEFLIILVMAAIVGLTIAPHFLGGV